MRSASRCIAAALVVVALAASAGACGGGEDAPSGSQASVEAILASPDEFLGDTVAVPGEIAQVVGPRAFILEPRIGGRGMLVLGAESIQAGAEVPFVGQEARVRVEGIVRPLDPEELDAKRTQLSHEARDRLADLPGFAAERVAVVEPSAAMSSGVTAEELARHSSRYYDRPVTVGGRVERVLSATVAILKPRLLLISHVNSAPGLERGEYVQVRGVFERFDQFSKLDSKLGGELDAKLLRPLEGRPVLIGRDIELALAP